MQRLHKATKVAYRKLMRWTRPSLMHRSFDVVANCRCRGGAPASSISLVGVISKVVQKTSADGTAGSGDFTDKDAGMRLANSLLELPQVPRAPAAVVTEAEEPICVAEDRHELTMVGSVRRLQTKFDEVAQQVPNYGLLISVTL